MNIFISYRSINRAIIQELISDLESMGHEVWYDQELQGGQKWWDNILQNIRQCDLLIFAMTPDSLESHPCQLEYTYANALGKNIVPVQLADGVNYSLLPVILQERQIVNYIQRDKEAFKELSAAIRNQPASGDLPDPLPKPPPAPISPLAPLKSQIDQPTLSYEEQVALVHQLKGYTHHTEHGAGARELLGRLSEHHSLLASVLRDIEEALNAEPPAPHRASSEAATVAADAASTPEEPPDWLREDETIHKEMLISYKTSSMWVGKRLILTNHRLMLNRGALWILSKETIEIPLQDITHMEKKVIAFVNPAIILHTSTGDAHTIMLDFGTGVGVGNRDEFIALVKQLQG